jgi:hypothetical protein
VLPSGRTSAFVSCAPAPSNATLMRLFLILMAKDSEHGRKSGLPGQQPADTLPGAGLTCEIPPALGQSDPRPATLPHYPATHTAKAIVMPIRCNGDGGNAILRLIDSGGR